jgi:hypothetical protein
MAAYNADELPGAVVFPQVREWETTASGLVSERRTWLARQQASRSPILEGVLEEWPRRSESGDTTWMRAVVESVLEAVVIRPRSMIGTNVFEYDRIEYVWRRA